ncbi:MAG: tetratricopeptide repeat protein, partial [Candidatus Latescibacteria bacterium]|nr:tetratricopeptide repeat protein [Candidatus Latescibacterota bacterium]
MYRQVINEFPDSDRAGEAVSGIMDSYLSRGQVDRAIGLIDEYLAQSPHGRMADTMLSKKGDLYYNMKRYDEARQAYNQLVERYPRSEHVPYAMYWRAMASYDGGDVDTAVDSFKKLKEAFPDHDYGALASMKLGDTFASRGQYGEAVRYYDAVISQRKGDTLGLEAQFKKGRTQMLSGDAAASERTLRSLIADHPNDIMAHQARLELAEMLLDHGDYDEAVRFAEIVIENLLDEHAAHAQYIIGKRYFLAGDYQRAFDELMRVTILYKNVKNYEEWAARSK